MENPLINKKKIVKAQRTINYADIFLENNNIWFANNINSSPIDDWYERMRDFPLYCGDNVTKRFYLEYIWRQGTINPYILNLSGRQGSGKSSCGVTLEDFTQFIQLRGFSLNHIFDKEIEMLRHALYEKHQIISAFHCDEVKKKSFVGYDLMGQYSWLDDSYTRMRARENWITKCSVSLEDDIISPYTLMPFQSIRNPLNFKQQIIVSCKLYSRHPQNFRQTLIGYINIPLALGLVTEYFKTTKKKIISTPHLIEVQSTYPKEWESIIAELLNDKDFLEIPIKKHFIRTMYIHKFYNKFLKAQGSAKKLEEMMRYAQEFPDSAIFKSNADRPDTPVYSKKEIIKNFEIQEENVIKKNKKNPPTKVKKILNNISKVKTKIDIESQTTKEKTAEQAAIELINKHKNPAIIAEHNKRIKSLINKLQ